MAVWQYMKIPSRYNTTRWLLALAAAVAIPVALSRASSWPPVDPSKTFTVLEVLGPPGTTASATFSVPVGGVTLWLQINGLGYQNKASISIGSTGNWISLNNTNCVFDFPGSLLNGMGGPLSTLAFTIPSALVKSGKMTVNFRFNASDNVSIGYRVMAINILDANGNRLMSETKPITSLLLSATNSPSDIAAGGQLWTNAPLLATWTGAPIQAKCMDCHAADGGDLKFYGFSDLSIAARSVFHGLTWAQGRQVAAYVRNNSQPTLGNPWDPPYQPGPGQSTRPYSQWAAGAGLKWVAPADSNTWTYAFSGGSPQFNFTNTLNMRDIPIATPLPVWNEWLPRKSPLEYFGSSFQPLIDTYRGIMAQTNPVTVANMIQDWMGYFATWRINNCFGQTSSDPDVQTASWSATRWMTVRTWEIMHQHGMEGQAQQMFSFPVDPHSWPNNVVFMSSPHFTLPETGHILGDGTALSWSYRSHQWYWSMMVLNDSNHRRQGAGPIDWPYLLSFSTVPGSYGVDSTAQMVLALVKSGESGTADPYNHDDAFFGWAVTRTEYLDALNSGAWMNYDPAYRDSIIRAFLQTYTQYIYTLGRTYFRDVTAEIADGETNNTPVPPMAGPWIGEQASMMVRFNQAGVASDIHATMLALAQYLWPSADWSGS